MFSSITIDQQKTTSFLPLFGRDNILQRFMKWAEDQNSNRLFWLGVALLAHASLLTPFTAMAVMVTSNNFALVMASLSAMGLALVTNLAALPTKVTIPAFFLSIVIDVVVVAITLSL